MTTHRAARIDFHLHSYASNETTYYAANAFAIPESYSDPLKLHPMLKSRGMDLVTLTDHNSIDGAKLLLDKGYPDVFLSSELTCRFPEDGCHIHLTVANVTEAQFAEANRLRENIYELIAWLEQQRKEEATHKAGNRIAWFMTHPLMSTENRAYGREGSLSMMHLEKLMVLLRGFEVQNGARTRALNGLTRDMIEGLHRLRIEDYANRYNLAPNGETPWQKFVVAGSDDHAGINPGRTWTEFPMPGNKPTPNDLIDAMRRRESRPGGIHGGPVTLAHSLLKLLYDGTKQKELAETTGDRRRKSQGLTISGPFNALLELVFDSPSQGLASKAWFNLKTLYHQLLRSKVQVMGVPFEKILEQEIYALLSESDFRDTLRAAHLTTDDRIFMVFGTLVNRIFRRYVENLKANKGSNMISVIKELVALSTSHLFVSLPYLVSFLQQSSDSMISRDVRKAFQFEQKEKLVLMTDTFFEINGVTATIRRMIREARRREVSFTVITCLGERDKARYLTDPEVQTWVEEGRLKIFTAVAEMDFPEYDGLKILFPPLLELLAFLQDSGFTKVQVSTPGTIGLTGLFAAKLLQQETSATYHTSVPEYVENYTRDVALEALAWKYMILFYHSVDEVLVPSRFIAKLLHKRGLRNRKLLILDRWVDVERFTPAKRVAGYWKKHGIADETLRFVYVGRVGVEKNLALMAQAFRAYHEKHPRSHLIIIGDGPYRKDLEGQLTGLPATFTGFLGGEELPKAIASCDVKLFPSTTDTWGNAPLEAQACGLPVIVSEVGGPHELMLPGITGLKVTGREVQGLVEAMEHITDPATRERMAKAARSFTEENRVDQPFTAIFDSNGYRKRVAEQEATGTRRVSVMNQVLDLTAPAFEAIVDGDRSHWPEAVA